MAEINNTYNNIKSKSVIKHFDINTYNYDEINFDVKEYPVNDKSDLLKKNTNMKLHIFWFYRK